MAMGSRAGAIAIRLLCVLLAVMFLFAGGTKLAGMQAHVEHFAKWGYPDWFRLVVGATEIVCGVLLLIPGAAFYGAIILAVQMIGAVYTHLTNNETPQAIVPVVAMALLLVVAYSKRPVAAPAAGSPT